MLSERWRGSQENEYHSQAGSTKLALNLGFHYARKAQLMSQMPDPSPNPRLQALEREKLLNEPRSDLELFIVITFRYMVRDIFHYEK